jgi:hypothetical protein
MGRGRDGMEWFENGTRTSIEDENQERTRERHKQLKRKQQHGKGFLLPGGKQIFAMYLKYFESS